MIRTYGSDALVAVVRSYKDGRTDDEAFQKGLGVGVAAFSSAWLADLGAEAPTRFGPQPAPPGPIPSAWLSGGSAPAATAKAAAGTAAASAGPASPASPQAPAPGGGGDPTALILAIVTVGIVIVVALAVRRRWQRAGAGPVT
jgi:hypothetical protein